MAENNDAMSKQPSAEAIEAAERIGINIPPAPGTFGKVTYYNAFKEYEIQAIALTLDAFAAQRLTERDVEIERLREIISEAYQVVGALAHSTGLFDPPDVIRALDNFSKGIEGQVPHTDLLPFPKTPLQAFEVSQLAIERLEDHIKTQQDHIAELEAQVEDGTNRNCYPPRPA